MLQVKSFTLFWSPCGELMLDLF